MKLYSTIVSAMVLGATAINSITGGVDPEQMRALAHA